MENTVVCNTCREMFTVDGGQFCVVKDGDLEVQYFICPHCGEKYIILATDSEMRGLIATVVETSKKLRLAHAKRFRAEEIRKYERVLAITKRRQEQIAPELKKRGYAVLKEAPNEPKQ